MKLDRHVKLDESSVSCGISVFRELGFIETSGASVARYITLVPDPGHMELGDSVRYREGLDELEVFKAFKGWVLKADAGSSSNASIGPSCPMAWHNAFRGTKE